MKNRIRPIVRFCKSIIYIDVHDESNFTFARDCGVLRRWRTTLLLLLTVAISLFARTRDGTEEARLCVRDA